MFTSAGCREVCARRRPACVMQFTKSGVFGGRELLAQIVYRLWRDGCPASAGLVGIEVA